MELDETHSGKEGDLQGPVLMDEPRDATIEEVANNFAKEQERVSNAPSFSIKEPEASKRGRKILKPVVEQVSTAKTTR